MVQELDKDYKLKRYSFCPKHTVKSSDFKGLQQDIDGTVWGVFRCKETDEAGVGHLFNARVGPEIPVTPDDVAGWIQQQKMAVMHNNMKSGQ